MSFLWIVLAFLWLLFCAGLSPYWHKTFHLKVEAFFCDRTRITGKCSLRRYRIRSPFRLHPAICRTARNYQPPVPWWTSLSDAVFWNCDHCACLFETYQTSWFCLLHKWLHFAVPFQQPQLACLANEVDLHFLSTESPSLLDFLSGHWHLNWAYLSLVGFEISCRCFECWGRRLAHGKQRGLRLHWVAVHWPTVCFISGTGVLFASFQSRPVGQPLAALYTCVQALRRNLDSGIGCPLKADRYF